MLPADSARTRWLVLDQQDMMSPAQTARVVQRLIEIEIYRMTALLAFPLARSAFPELNRIEQRLAEITAATAALHGRGEPHQTQDEERRLLDELTGVASEVERSVAATSFRFSAGEAYWNLVQARVREFREQRIGDLRTLGGFLARRLAPAMNSCAAAARRQEELSARIERAMQPLRAVMLERLGPTVWHTSPAAAMALLEELEETARLWLLGARALQPLSEAQIAELRTQFNAPW